MPSHSTAPSSESELLPSGPNGFITFLYYFGLTSLILSVAIAQSLHLDLGTPTPYQYAFILGVIGGIWGAYFNRSVTLELKSHQPQNLLANLENKLNELGFIQCQEQDGIRIYSPRFLPSLFMGKIRILVQENQVRIVGRAVHIQKLQQSISISSK
jgi:hypothetical protein